MSRPAMHSACWVLPHLALSLPAASFVFILSSVISFIGASGDNETTLTTPPATLPVSTTEAFGPNAPEFYLWLPLIVVILFTGIMIGLILVGRKRDIEEAQATAEQEPVTVWLISEVTASQKQPVYVSSTTKSPESGQQVATDIDLLSILVVIAIFVICIVVCTVLGCRHKGSHGGHSEMTGSSAIGEEGVSLTDSNLRRDNPGYADSEMAAPDTPPPTYSMIERQTSYVSYISQTSSMCSVPPEYDEATELPIADHNANRRSRFSRSGSSGRRNRSARNNSLQALRARFQGRRAHSVTEVPQRGIRSSSITSDGGIPEVPSNRDSENSEVFDDDITGITIEAGTTSPHSASVGHPPSSAIVVTDSSVEDINSDSVVVIHSHASERPTSVEDAPANGEAVHMEEPSSAANNNSEANSDSGLLSTPPPSSTDV